MNKQELASRIWSIANDLRGSMEASEYKDYILSFIFYKYLSDNEYNFLIKQGYDNVAIKEISESNMEEVEWIKDNIGYFIAPENLFQTWIEKGNQFGIDDVMPALSAFQRSINNTDRDRKAFGGIFQALESGLSNLGTTAKQQSKQVRDLVNLIRDIPTTHDKYDVLGYIYEYLIGHFAAGAGKKAGEFYTPHEVAEFMAEVVTNHLEGYSNITIYDPTSGSGSLLLTVGHGVEQDHESSDSVLYYAQDKIRSTEVLTRMNLLMRGVKPANMISRNGDSLERDFPWFDENDPEGTYRPVFVDAVISNPPYSQKWDPSDKEQDSRFAYGLAPKGKADYAFLLHGLYHLKPDGIMCIVLPHGVLFRGGEEGRIRQNLVDNHNIDAIIGLPANIFFGTGIPTIVMVLKKELSSKDILFVDASNGFEKDGNKNKLRASDIKRISDTVTERRELANYSHLASMDEIRANKYNLNIPRYVNSSDKSESWDLYATVNGGIPKQELQQFDGLFDILPSLYDELFTELNSGYIELKSDNIHEVLSQNSDVADFHNRYAKIFSGFSEGISNLLMSEAEIINTQKTKGQLVEDLFRRFDQIPLIDKYEAYQIFDENWTEITNDIELIQRDGFETAVHSVDPNMVIKERSGHDVEVQEGWRGRIIPFKLVQETLLKFETDELSGLVSRQIKIQDDLTQMIESLSEENGEYCVLNDKNDKFLIKETKDQLADLLADIDIPGVATLDAYQELTSLVDQKDFIKTHKEIDWANMALKKNGLPTVKALRDYSDMLKHNYEFSEDTFGAKLSSAISLMDEEKIVKSIIKEKEEALDELTNRTIKELSYESIRSLLNAKWIEPIEDGLTSLVDNLFNTFKSEIIALQKKYSETVLDIEKDIAESSKGLIEMLDQLTGSNIDMAAITQLQELLAGDSDD